MAVNCKTRRYVFIRLSVERQRNQGCVAVLGTEVAISVAVISTVLLKRRLAVRSVFTEVRAFEYGLGHGFFQMCFYRVFSTAWFCAV
jgi:cytochrome c biogenesis protein ResB